MNQVLSNKKVLLVGNNRISRPNHKNRLGDFVGSSSEHIFSPNHYMVFFNYVRDRDVILWDLPHPLNGCLSMDEIQQLSNLPLGNQVTKLPQDKMDRWFFEGFWEALTEQEINFLYSTWLKKVSFFLECTPGIIILPVTTAYFDSQLPLKNCLELLQTLNCKIIDFQISSFSRYPFEGERGDLNDVAWRELMPRMLEAING
jgi:hypothetical protein